MEPIPQAYELIKLSIESLKVYILCSAVYFKAEREELERAGESMDDKVELEQGGYLANLGVYHELHCLVSRPFN